MVFQRMSDLINNSIDIGLNDDKQNKTVRRHTGETSKGIRKLSIKVYKNGKLKLIIHNYEWLD